jgi:hypothetical protein
MHQLLPEYACIQHGGDLAKTTEIDLPDLQHGKVADGMRLHTHLAVAEAARPDSLANTHAILGIHQPTPTTARLTGPTVALDETYRAEDLFGDSTVPIVAACRSDVPMDSNTLRRVPDKHGNLQANPAALDEIEGVLTASPVVVKAPDTVDLRVDVPELILAGDDLPVRVTTVDEGRHGIRITVTDQTGKLVDSRASVPSKGTSAATIDALAPGAYTIDVTGIGAGTPIAPVSCDVLVWDPPQIA